MATISYFSFLLLFFFYGTGDAIARASCSYMVALHISKRIRLTNGHLL